MALLLPQLGLFFWTTVIFLGFFFALRKFAWKPILEMLRQREADIAQSLEQAKAARDEMSRLKSDNEALMKEARIARDKILKDAQVLKDQIIAEAKQIAQAEASREREKALQQIQAEKRAALIEIKNLAATLSVDLAEKILRKEFENREVQEAFANTLVKDLSNN